VDRSLRQVRFAPRPSLEAELLRRLRARPGEASTGLPAATLALIAAASLALIAAVLVGTLVFLFWVELLTVAAGAR
jgi:hypothetical protein